MSSEHRLLAIVTEHKRLRCTASKIFPPQKSPKFSKAELSARLKRVLERYADSRCTIHVQGAPTDSVPRAAHSSCASETLPG